MHRERAGNVLATVGVLVALVSIAFAFRLPEVEVERDGGLEPRWHIARGPALGRYDAQNDTTYVVFACSHWWCHVAVSVQGDVTDRLDGSSFLLRPLDDAPESLRRFDPPVVLQEPFAPVENTTAARFALHVPHAPAVATALGLAAVLVGLHLLNPLHRGLLPGALLGLALGLATISQLGAFLLIILGIFVLLPGMAIGAILSIVMPRRSVGFLVLASAIAFVLVAFAVSPLYPSAPEV